MRDISAGGPRQKTFVVVLGAEPWPVETTPEDHTFECFTVEEAMHDTLRNALQGVPCRIVATEAWIAANGPLPEYVGKRRRVRA